MCGEHADGNKTIQGAKGSSPHVRGALARRFASGSATGIIPACAGSTPMSPTGRGAMWDHPRMCGEHSRPMKSRSNCGGSSPHVRGARQSRSLINLSLGIIPACAGSTFVIVYPPRFSRDHPRMCGEHLWMQASTGATSGSSPHVRGALWPRVSGRASIGIIPACAGSTRGNRDYCLLSGDHPRMCGEHWPSCGKRCVFAGSSPHVRGARFRTATR